MKLALVQIVLGALVTVFASIATRGCPTQFTFTDENGIVHIVEELQRLTIADVSAFLAMVLGLAVLGCGIAQLIKARGQLLKARGQLLKA
jgi:hypothetical protein